MSTYWSRSIYDNLFTYLVDKGSLISEKKSLWLKTKRCQFATLASFFSWIVLRIVIWHLLLEFWGKVKKSLRIIQLYQTWSLWHSRLWSFQGRDTKLESFLHKNQHAPRKLLNFENWISGGLRSFQKSGSISMQEMICISDNII